MTGQRIRIHGIVQGVGFRPTVWRLARDEKIVGEVWNDAEGVEIHAWGSAVSLERFAKRLRVEPPPLAHIEEITVTPLDAAQTVPVDFQIVPSRAGEVHTDIAADAATCPECLAEIFNPENRRYRYPFTNCTHCGPRFSIIDAMPYDRASTSMAGFALCPSCEAEYRNPADRRFHAQATCCPECGPKLWLEGGASRHVEHDVIAQAAQLIGEGNIVAIKGIGGFHLVCDATNDEAVQQLRARKRRPHKPFALMARDMAMVREYVKLSEEGAAALQSREAPIVLLEQTPNSLPPLLAPKLNTLGFMLPYTPLHHLLLAQLQRPLVMTSANRCGELLITDNGEARARLSEIADYFVMHDREIVNCLDDSVVRDSNGRPRVMRRARGYTPTPLRLPLGHGNEKNILAMGAEMKGSFCLVKKGVAITSQYMGDLKGATTYRHYQESIERYCKLYDFVPDVIAIDSHPNYLSSQWGRVIAAKRDIPVVEVQHHHAHIAAVMAEHGLADDGTQVLGVALDGLGYGDDGTLWGGEFLLADYHGYERLAAFEPVAMPGGNQAIVEPWRNTFAHLDHFIGWDHVGENYGDLELVDYLGGKPLSTLRGMIEKGLNSPRTSSAGRLFDAVAAALGICREGSSYDGQAAIELEALASQAMEVCSEGYGYTVKVGRVGWQPLWTELLADLRREEEPAVIAARFHHGVAESVCKTVMELCAQSGISNVVLSGGVWQNRVLLELCSRRMRQQGLAVLMPERIPLNDGGIALGQGAIVR